MQEDKDGTAKLLYQAFKKYGIDAFEFGVIEENVENYDEREVYWISYYNTYGEDGYNMTPGGSAPPILKGLNSSRTTHSLDQVAEVKRLLLETNLSIKEITQLVNYDDSAVRRINSGIIWKDENLTYPLRKEVTADYNLNRILCIINDLQSTKLTQKEIAKKYGVSRSAVTMINTGENARQEGIQYPIRDKKKNQQSKTVLMLDKETNEVLKEFVNAQEAAKEVKVTAGAIGMCCRGDTKTSGGYKWKYKDE